VLRDTEFRRFWTGSTVSMFGDQVSSIAVPLTAVLALHAGMRRCRASACRP
jgi:hypothetical protein